MLDEALKCSVVFWLTKSSTSLWPWQSCLCLARDSRVRKMPCYKYSATAPLCSIISLGCCMGNCLFCTTQELPGLLCHSLQPGFGQRPCFVPRDPSLLKDFLRKLLCACKICLARELPGQGEWDLITFSTFAVVNRFEQV